MNIKEIIISLLIEDMRFNQYKSTLRKLNIEVYFDFELMNVVANLMGIKTEDMSDSWMELYVEAISECESFSIKPLGKNLYPLAEACYESLKNFRF